MVRDINREANLLSRLDRMPYTPTTVGIMVLLIVAWILESFDIGMAGTLIVSLKKAWQLSNSQVGILGVATTIGVVIGLIPGGRLADKYGRKRVLIWGIIMYSVLTFLSAFAPNFETFVILRILAGLGEGAVFPIPYLMLSEFVNSRKRGASIGWVNGTLTAAYAFPLLTGAWLMKIYPLEDVWSLMSMLGGIPLIYIIPLLLWLPESPRFLLKMRKYDELERLVEKMEKQANLSHDRELMDANTVQALTQSAKTTIPMSAIFKAPYLLRSFVAYMIFAYSIYMFYVFNVYGPTIFAKQGLNLGNALTFTAIMMVIGGIGTVIHGMFSDKYGRKIPLLIYAALSTVGALIFAYGEGYTSVLVAGGLAALFGLSVNPFGKLYMSEQYPTEIRGVGVATGEMIARFLAGVAGLYFVPMLLALGGAKVVFLSLVAFAVVANIPMLLWGRDTANISVEAAGSVVEDTGTTEQTSSHKSINR